MNINYTCGTDEHTMARRSFLGTMTAGAGAVVGGLGAFANPGIADQLRRDQKRMIVIELHGGVSQLESWDPKPGTDTGGPFRAIPTSVPGVHISELLPHTAKQMHHLSLIRSINIHENDHGKGRHKMLTGYKQTPAGSYPELGAVVAKGLDDGSSGLPGNIKIYPSASGSRSADSAYLGPKYGSVLLDGGKAPANSARPDAVSAEADKRRNLLRASANERFLQRRRTAYTDAYTQSYEQAAELMARREIFDLAGEPEKDKERYGAHDFGRHCLLARRLAENGISYVHVRHSNYDTHNENFNFHFEQLGEFDKPFATLVTDLADRGMLESTLIVVLSEFGRTPRINERYGRDHWGKAWSIALGGAGIQPGAVIGATNKNGTEVSEREVDAGHLFHTYLRAVGLKSNRQFNIGGRKFPMADPATEPIRELLA
jgi:uncharacterized protein (DUF1501 family)